MSARIVVSVGTSLFTNNRVAIAKHFGCLKETFKEKTGTEDFEKLSFFFEDENPTKFLKTSPNPLKGVSGFSGDFFKLYLNENAVLDNIKKRADGYEDCLPAEISSLFLYYYEPSGKLRDNHKSRLKEGAESEFAEKDEIIFITTPTSDSVYCTKMLKEMLVRLSFFNTKCEVIGDANIIKGLDVLQPDKYITEGLKDLFSYFQEITSSSAGREKILIRTGSFKEVSADLKMIAMQFGFESYYLFEGSVSFVVVKIDGWPNGYQGIIDSSKRFG